MSNFLKKDVSGMPSSRPRGMSGAGSGGSGRPAVTAPMSERQQMALLMQMTSNSGTNDAEMSPGGNTGSAHSRTTRDRINERGETALHIASKKGDQDTVKKLLEQGANPNVTDFAGWTPLHEACNHGHYNVALALVKAGANINATGLENATPLHDAAITGQLKLVKMLVERGADPTFKNQKGKAPCDVAAAAVYNYLLQARDNAIGRHGYLRKSSADTGTGAVGKKAHGSIASSNHGQHGNPHVIDVDDASSRMGGSGAVASVRGKDKDEDDIYEFKSTPKDSSSSSSDEKEGSNGATGAASKKGDKSGEERQSSGANHGSVPSHLVHQDLGPGGRAGQAHNDGQSHHQTSRDQDDKHPHIVGQLNASGGGGSNGGSEISSTLGGSGSFVSSSGVPKRSYSEMIDGADESGPPNEDETKRKRRKDVDPLGGIKEASVGPLPPSGGKSGVGNRGAAQRQEKGGKGSGGTPSSKNLGLSAKNALDRKSPCASPKLSGNNSAAVIVGGAERNAAAGGASGAASGSNVSSVGGGGSSSSSSGKGSSTTSSSNDSDGESGAGAAGGTDDGMGGGKGGDSGFGGGGPKVPPLKIVIPQQSAGGDTDTVGSTRNGKNVSTRNHAALPYVVASSNSNDSTADKESTSSRSASPADSKSSDEKNQTQASKDERTQQRVLRSSHRGGGGNSNSSLKDGSMDRSNNSSPQMQQHGCNSPSPHSNSGCDAAGHGASSKEAGTTSQGSAGNRANSPNAPGGTGVGEAEGGSGAGGLNPKSPAVVNSSSGPGSGSGAGSADGSGSGGNGSGGPNASSGGNNGTAGAASGGANGNTSAQASGTAQGGSSNSSSSSTSSSSSANSETSVHPRKRKIKSNKEQSSSGGAAGGSNASGSNASSAGAAGGSAASSSASTSASSGSGNTASGGAGSASEDKKDAREDTADVHPHDQPITNCYQMYLNIRKQIERRQKGLFPVQPKPPQGFKDYLMNRCTYVLAGKTTADHSMQVPVSLPPALKDLFQSQEKERHKLKMQHIVEKEKLVLAVEQEILRVHGRAARALANQSLPFSVCTILKDEEVYNIITPEQEEKDRNARSRYNGRLFLSWLQDVDDKWEKIKEAMLLRHHNEAESLHAVQKMDWEFNMKEHSLCEFKAKPIIDDTYVPMVNVNDDFDLLPA